jgi:hypothetical protein
MDWGRDGRLREARLLFKSRSSRPARASISKYGKRKKSRAPSRRAPASISASRNTPVAITKGGATPMDRNRLNTVGRTCRTDGDLADSARKKYCGQAILRETSV